MPAYKRNRTDWITRMATKSFKDSLLRGIALLGLIVVLVLGAWGIILLAFNLPSFLGSVGTSISALFTREDGPSPLEEPDVPVVVTPTQPTTPQPAPTGAPGPSYVYTPAPQVPQLYGLPDISVRILSITPAGSRYTMQFVIENIGTNVARSGWSFNALLPIQTQPAPTGASGYMYTYTAPAQQALYPGDKIVYTLGFDRPYQQYPEVCTLQYPNPNCPWQNYPYDYNYNNQNCGYTYDGYTNRWECKGGYNYPNYNYGNQNYWYGGNLPAQAGRTVTITVDPYNMLYEQNRYNNTASQTLNYW